MTTLALIPKRVRASIMRLPQVHDRNRQGLVTYLIALAREKGLSAYVGEGRNRWAAIHRLDAAVLYRLALEQGAAGGQYHAVAEAGVSLWEIAEAIGRRLGVPSAGKTEEEVPAHFGGLPHSRAWISRPQAPKRKRYLDGGLRNPPDYLPISTGQTESRSGHGIIGPQELAARLSAPHSHDTDLTRFQRRNR